MATFNQCTFIGSTRNKGNLGQSERTTFTNFTLMVHGKGKGKDALFVRCCVFGKTADFVDQFMTDGSQVCVSGELEKRSYTSKTGEKKDSYQLIVREFQLLRSGGNSVQEEKMVDDNFGNMNSDETF